MQTRDKVKGLHNCWELSLATIQITASLLSWIFQIYSVWIHRIAKPKKAKIFVFFKIYFVRLIKMCFVLYGLLISNYICMELYLFWPLFDFLKEAKHFKSKFLCIADVHTMKLVFRLDQLKWNTLYLFIMKTPIKYQVSFRVKTWYLHMWK